MPTYRPAVVCITHGSSEVGRVIASPVVRDAGHVEAGPDSHSTRAVEVHPGSAERANLSTRRVLNRWRQCVLRLDCRYAQCAHGGLLVQDVDGASVEGVSAVDSGDAYSVKGAG